MQSLITLWQKVAEDFATRCCTSATMDIKTVQGRIEHEGLSFLTITLPSFGKEFQKALDLGRVDRNSFVGFAFARKEGVRLGIPAFLQVFLGRVFNPSTGVLLDDPDIDAILAVRQLTLMFSKILLPCSDTRIREAMNGFIECELDVKQNDRTLRPSDMRDFERVSSVLFRSLFSKVDSDVYYGKIVPKHGPGSTAERILGNKKFRHRTWTARLERVFPFGEFLFPSWSYYDHFDSVDIHEPGDEQPVRVIHVPKTLKTPRIIAIEPVHMQYVQQGLLENILHWLERDDILSSLLGFSDQIPNQEMAREGSLSGDLATLDLSEASDRVSNQHVRALLRHHPHLREAVDACRSRKADVPGHGVVRLAKFASMGSALCFPMEAMVFLTCVFIGIERELNTPVSKRMIKSFLGKVRIYGDDIIIPVEFVRSVVESLELFGAKVGSSKSFWNGKFRESCGKDYYDGYDVSYVKVRRMFPLSRRHVPEVISLVSLRNQLYFAGCWGTVKWLDDKILGILKWFPVVESSSQVLGRHTFLDQYDSDGMHETLHRPFVKGWIVSSRLPLDHLEGPGALLKFFLKRGGQPSVDGRHLERAGRPHAVDIKLRSRISPF